MRIDKLKRDDKWQKRIAFQIKPNFLEQQAQYPENSSKGDQEDLTEEINRSRVKLLSLQKLLKDHETKILAIIKGFSEQALSTPSDCGGCAG